MRSMIPSFAALLSCCIAVAMPASAARWSRVIGPANGSGTEVVEPLVIRGERSVLVRNVRISNPDGPCIDVGDSVDVRIINSDIGPCGTYSSESDDSDGYGVLAHEVDGLLVAGTRFTDTFKGVYALESRQVAVANNRFQGVGRNMVQFDKVTGPGNRISRNVGDYELGNAVSEDLINLYQSEGTEDSPLRVVDNRLRNGGSSSSGSGILVGDDGGAHQLVARNVLINPGQIGIGVAAGTDIRIVDNVVLGDFLPWSNNGITVWKQYDRPCARVVVARNRVSWIDADAQVVGWWPGEGRCDPLVERRNDFAAPIGPEAFDLP